MQQNPEGVQAGRVGGMPRKRL